MTIPHRSLTTERILELRKMSNKELYQDLLNCTKKLEEERIASKKTKEDWDEYMNYKRKYKKQLEEDEKLAIEYKDQPRKMNGDERNKIGFCSKCKGVCRKVHNSFDNMPRTRILPYKDDE